MDIKQFQKVEKIQNEFEKLNNERFEYIKNKLGLYISNYHLKKGDDMSKYPEVMEKINQDKNEILDYINELHKLNKNTFELTKILQKEIEKKN